MPMNRKRLLVLVLAMLTVCTWLAMMPCFADTDTAVPDTELVTDAESQTEPTEPNVIPQVSWWARLMASIGLGPLAAIAGVVMAVLTAGIVIAVVKIHDCRKTKRNQSE